jgi:DNA-binding response OmpR family regulator
MPPPQPDTSDAQLSLLLIDDDAELCNMMREYFAEMQCRLSCAFNGRDGLEAALRNHYDLVILDVMLPGVPGFTVLQQLRSRKDVPVVMLTARVDPKDRITGLNTGADDYLPKPFDPDELLARIRAVLRRTDAARHTDQVFAFGDLEVNKLARQVWKAGELLDLTSLEFDILQLLVEANGRVVTREEIMPALFERDATPYDRSLDVHISHLRKKLERGHTLIRTVRGTGYVFTADREQGR